MGKNYCDFSPFLFPSTIVSYDPSSSSSSSSYSSLPLSSPSSPSLNSHFQISSSLPLHPYSQSSSSSFHPPPPPAAAAGGPCAACKIHGRRCTDKCFVASYLPLSEAHKFIVFDGLFGATNVVKFLQNNNSSSFIPLLLLLRDTSQEGQPQVDPSLNIVPCGTNQLGAPKNSDHVLTKASTGLECDFLNNLSSGLMFANPKDPQQELPSSSSMVPKRQKLYKVPKDSSQEGELQADSNMNNVPYGTNIDGQIEAPMNSNHIFTKGTVGLGYDFLNNLSSGVLFANPKHPQLEPPPLMVSKNCGIPNVVSNSINSTVNLSSIFNRDTSESTPQLQQNQTFVKIYKSGSSGRTLDIAKFSSYHELVRELDHIFCLQGKLEDPLRSGWHVVFVDRENDVLLLGDDPWLEFVDMVWCIKLLSPQEAQQFTNLVKGSALG